MGHDHHHHLPVDHLNRAFVLGIVLNLVFVCVEFGAGLWFDSVALISDAGHYLSDVVSLVLSLIAFRLARVKPTASYTYGYRKSTVLVSLLNACILHVDRRRVPLPGRAAVDDRLAAGKILRDRNRRRRFAGLRPLHGRLPSGTENHGSARNPQLREKIHGRTARKRLRAGKKVNRHNPETENLKPLRAMKTS